MNDRVVTGGHTRSQPALGVANRFRRFRWLKVACQPVKTAQGSGCGNEPRFVFAIGQGDDHLNIRTQLASAPRQFRCKGGRTIILAVEQDQNRTAFLGSFGTCERYLLAEVFFIVEKRTGFDPDRRIDAQGSLATDRNGDAM
jgi:hypothetical protein